MSEFWVGCDLDYTLARFDEWKGSDHIGEPVPAMVERVKFWLKHGIEVRLMTARVASSVPQAEVDKFLRAANHWMLTHLGTTLPITAEKDYGMLCLYDDRCVAIEKNTGRALSPDYLMIAQRLCGCKEECFKIGPRWGHLEGVLCDHLTEVNFDGKCTGWCSKFDTTVTNLYTNEEEYSDLKGEPK